MTKDWHHLFKGPYQGFSVYYINLGNAEQLGNMYSLFPYIGFPLKQSERGALIAQLGCGLAIVDRKFDQEDNFTNFVIGSHTNVGIQLALKYQYTAGRFLLGTGLSFSHASNGSYQLPNLGANVPSLDFYLGYRLNEEEIPVQFKDIETPLTSVTNIDVSLGFGMRESNVVTRVKHPVIELRADYRKSFSQKMNYIIGTDLIYNKASYAERDRDSVRVIESLLPGIKLGLGMTMGTSELFMHAGWYPHTGYQQLGSLYHRVGGRKVINDKWICSFTLKTHFARADYFALGLGMRVR
jgi:hypothetical protein